MFNYLIGVHEQLIGEDLAVEILVAFLVVRLFVCDALETFEAFLK